MRRIITAIVALAALSTIAAPSAGAAAGPPVTQIRYGGQNVQKGVLGTHCWSNAHSGWCADYFGYQFPNAAAVPADETLRLRIKYAQRPEVYLHAWKRVDADRQPIGPGQDIRFRLKKVRRDGATVAYDALFELPDANRHYYLNAFMYFDRGDASYDFHLKTGS